MELQGRAKCCFCERKFESGTFGRHELDIEHFRPKGEIRAWEVPQSLLDEGISCTPPPDAGHGYYLLAYHLLNLAVACKPCNSGLKKSYFPIGGTYDLHGDDPRRMGGEQPWLLYPIGDLDVDPEEVINFHGIQPQSTSRQPQFAAVWQLVSVLMAHRTVGVQRGAHPPLLKRQPGRGRLVDLDPDPRTLR